MNNLSGQLGGKAIAIFIMLIFVTVDDKLLKISELW